MQANLIASFHGTRQVCFDCDFVVGFLHGLFFVLVCGFLLLFLFCFMKETKQKSFRIPLPEVVLILTIQGL